MKFILRHFYNISAFVGVAILALTFIFWKDLHYLSALALLNLAVINIHFFEEFGFPGGFPKFANTMVATKNSPAPDRFPLNQMTALLTNWGTALVMFVPPIFFPNQIWLGLVPILFMGVAQLVLHGIVSNIMLKTWYNSGLFCVLFGHIPIAVFYIKYIVENHLASVWDWVFAVAFMVFWYVVVVRIIITKLFENINSPYPFDKAEMERFDKLYNRKKYCGCRGQF